MNRRGIVRAHVHGKPERRSAAAAASTLWRRFRGAARAVVCRSIVVAVTIAGLALAAVVIRGPTTGFDWAACDADGVA
jgi:hypothetical protein